MEEDDRPITRKIRRNQTTTTRLSAFTVSTGFQLVSPAGEQGNFIVFHNLIGDTFTLLATPGTGGTSRAPVNGVQIVSPAMH